MENNGSSNKVMDDASNNISFTSKNIKNTVSKTKNVEFAKDEKFFSKSHLLRHLPWFIGIGAFILALIITVVILSICLASANSDYVSSQYAQDEELIDEESDESDDVLTNEERDTLDDLIYKINIEEISQEQGASEIEKFFDNKLSTISDEDRHTKALILLEKAATLIYVSHFDEANSLVEEVAGYQDLSDDERYAVCSLGMDVNLEADNYDLYAKYKSDCNQFFEGE